jgi:Lrp/AsnC family leucine-responsive transcriptional regulator
MQSEAVRMKRLRYENGPVDAIDVRLLRSLSRNARTSLAELARDVGLSAPSVSERLKRLEETGVIKGYAVTIDPAALGRPVAAWLRVRPLPGELQRVADILKKLPEIVECDRVTGDDCFIARAHVKSMQDLERVIDQIIPYAMTNTSIIQSTPVERRMPPLVSERE